MNAYVWAYNLDPTFQRDIQVPVGLKVGLKKRHRCFSKFLIPVIQIPWNPAGCPGEGRLKRHTFGFDHIVPKMDMFLVEGDLISRQTLKKSRLEHLQV